MSKRSPKLPAWFDLRGILGGVLSVLMIFQTAAIPLSASPHVGMTQIGLGAYAAGQVPAAPVATITTKSPVTTAVAGQLASVPVQTGCTYVWSISGGTISNATNLSYVYYVPGPVGTCTLNCKVTNSAGVSQTGSAVVSVIAIPLISDFKASKTSVSAGEPFTLTGTYSNGVGVIDQGVGNAPSGTPMPTSTTISKYYWLTVTNAAGTTATKYVSITVYPPPDATVSAKSPVTAGEAGQMASVPAGAGSTYEWSIIGGTITYTGIPYRPVYTPGPVGTCTLTCKVTNAAGVSKTGSTTVNIVAAPVITDLKASKTSVSAGEPFTLTGTYSNGMGVIDQGVGAAPSGTAVTTSTGISNYYWLTVTNAAGTRVWKSISITTCPPTDATVSAASPVTSGDTSPRAEVPSVSGATYAWTISNGTIRSATNGYYIQYTPGAVGTCTMTCKVTNAAGVSKTGSATVNVIAAPVITDFKASKPTVSPGENFTLTGTFSNGKGAIDQGVGQVTSGTAATVKADITKYYWLTVTNPAGTSASKYITVTVTPTPNATVTAASPVTSGTSYLAQVPAVSGGSYLWTITGGTINSGATSYAVTYTPGGVGPCTLTCQVTNAAGVSKIGSATVTVIAAPVITELKASKTSVSVGENFTLIGTFSNGKGAIDQGIGQVSSTTPVTVKADVTKSYTLTVTNPAGTSVSKYISVTVTPAPDATITAASPITSGTSSLAQVPSVSGGSYLWTIAGGTNNSSAPSSTVTYTPSGVGTCTLTCQVTNAAGVSKTGSATVNVIAAPVITSLTASATTITAGQSLTLTPVFSNGNGSIDWGVGKVTSGTAKSVTPSATGYYTLTVTNLAGSSVTKYVNITVNPATTGGITTPLIVTTGAPSVYASVPYDATATYLWSVANGTMLTSATSYTMTYKAGAVGTTTLQCVITKGGIPTTRTVNVSVIAAPVITSFVSSKTSINSGDVFTLTGVFSNGTGIVDQGVGPLTSGTAVSATTTITRNYTLQVTNAAGTSVTNYVPIRVLGAPDTTINAASPVTSGENANASVPNVTGTTYAWTISGGTINSGATSSSVSYLPGPVGTCTLNCVVKNAAGVSKTGTATVNILAAPVITSFISSKTSISSGDAFTLTGVFSNGTGMVDQGVGPLASGTAVSATTTITRNYTLKVTNAAATSVTKYVSVNVEGVPDTTITAASPVTAGVSTNASVPNVYGTTYTWTISGGTITSGATNSSVSYLPGPVGTCTLTCVVKNAAGVSKTGTTTVNIIAPPTITSFNASKTHISAGDSYTLTAVFANGKGIIDKGIGQVTSGTAVFTSTRVSNSYRLTVANAAGNTAALSVGVTVEPAPEVVISAQSPITTGATDCRASVVPVTGGTYLWTTNNGIIDPNYVNSSSIIFRAGPVGKCTLNCKVTNAAGVVKIGTITIDVIEAPEIRGFTTTHNTNINGGTSVLQGLFKSGYGEVDNGVGPVTSGFSKSVVPTVATTYRLTVSNRAGKSVSAFASLFSMWVSPKAATLPAGFSQSFLTNSNLGTSIPVDWSVRETSGGTVNQDGYYKAPVTPGTYHLDIAAKSDATLKACATITVPVLLGIDPEYTELKPGTTQTFKAVFSGIPKQAVSWNGGTATTAPFVYTAPTTPGRYVISAACTGGTATATVDVVADGGISVAVFPSEIDLNKLGTTTFTAQVDGGKTKTVSWTCSSGTINATTGAYTAPNVFGTYTVKATSTEDGTAYGTATVTVKALAGADKTFAYDENGNMTSDGTRTFEWDAENRLIAVVITATGHRSEFGYDELGRRVQIRELAGTTLESDKKYLWDGVEIAEERDATGGIVQKRFYSQGFMDNDGTKLFYTRDHLGSVRELTDSSQAVRARYDYDPYGRMTKVSGDRDSFFGFTGHPWHAPSGLNLTLFRAYDPNLGRWISRDPISEMGGINLYAYVENSPSDLYDPDGLDPQGGERGRSGGLGGGRSANPWKHCKEYDPPDPRFVQCRDQNGKWKRKPRPSEMPFPEPKKCEGQEPEKAPDPQPKPDKLPPFPWEPGYNWDSTYFGQFWNSFNNTPMLPNNSDPYSYPYFPQPRRRIIIVP